MLRHVIGDDSFQEHRDKSAMGAMFVSEFVVQFASQHGEVVGGMLSYCAAEKYVKDNHQWHLYYQKHLKVATPLLVTPSLICFELSLKISTVGLLYRSSWAH